MARADREAVLRGVNARFDETGDDDAVIAALGSPTFAAVSVLRGYTPPERDEGEYEDDYEYAEPEPEEYAPAEPEEYAPAEPEEYAPPEQPEPDEGPEPVSDAPAPEPEEPPAGAEAPEAETEAPEAETEAESEPQEAEPGPDRPEEAGAASPALEAPAGGDAGPEEAGIPAPPETETVAIGGEILEVFAGPAAEPEDEAAAEPERAAPETPEPVSPAPAEAGPNLAPEAAYDAAEEAESAPEAPALPPMPEPEEERAPLRAGRVFLAALLGLVAGIPVAVVLIVFALAVLALGAALIYAGAVAISFAFLGMSVAADIMLCVGFGLFTAAAGLPVAFFALWFFVRCVVGLYSRMFAAIGAWCRGEVRK